MWVLYFGPGHNPFASRQYLVAIPFTNGYESGPISDLPYQISSTNNQRSKFFAHPPVFFEKMRNDYTYQQNIHEEDNFIEKPMKKKRKICISVFLDLQKIENAFRKKVLKTSVLMV